MAKDTKSFLSAQQGILEGLERALNKYVEAEGEVAAFAKSADALEAAARNAGISGEQLAKMQTVIARAQENVQQADAMGTEAWKIQQNFKNTLQHHDEMLKHRDRLFARVFPEDKAGQAIFAANAIVASISANSRHHGDFLSARLENDDIGSIIVIGSHNPNSDDLPDGVYSSIQMVLKAAGVDFIPGTRATGTICYIQKEKDFDTLIRLGTNVEFAKSTMEKLHTLLDEQDKELNPGKNDSSWLETVGKTTNDLVTKVQALQAQATAKSKDSNQRAS